MSSEKKAAVSTECTSDDNLESRNSGTGDELDFFSPNFNPRRALLASDVEVPFKEIKTFDSVQRYEEALKRRQGKSIQSQSQVSQPSSSRHNTETAIHANAPAIPSTSSLEKIKAEATPSLDATKNSFQNKGHHAHSPGSFSPSGVPFQFGRGRGNGSGAARQETSADNTIWTEKNLKHSGRGHHQNLSSSQQRSKPGFRNERNVLSRMAEMFGPMHMLTRCAEERLHVRVMTRGATLVRSICRGYIVAFDKHCNMALIDVDEVYRRPIVLGKVRARRSHKLKGAQELLQKEKATQAINKLKCTPTGIKSDSLVGDVKNEQMESSERKSEEPLNQLATQNPVKNSDKSVEMQHNLSPLARDALLLGVADENVEHRHVNQLLIRGENIVLISIIND